MHEFGLIEELVSQFSGQMPKRLRRVEAVRLRCSQFVSEEALRQAFEMLIPGTPLERAELRIEWRPVPGMQCRGCGWMHPLKEGEFGNHAFVCEDCGDLNPIPEEQEVEVLEILWDHRAGSMEEAV